MENAAVLTLAGLCLGIALTGGLSALLRQDGRRERFGLGLVYVAFIGMIALPLVRTFAEAALLDFMPLLLVLLLMLPPAFHHYIAARTRMGPPSGDRAQIPWRDLLLPLSGVAVCVGYWLLPAQAKEAMFLSGDLPPGTWPAVLALSTFALILIWLVASFAYLVAILRRLAAYRAHVRQLYTDVEKRDLRWVDRMMVLLVLIWAVGALSLVDDNLSGGGLMVEELFLMLNAGGLLCLGLLAPVTPADLPPALEEEAPDPKYARSALSGDHAAKLADRIERTMREDALYLDPGLSLHKLSRHVCALPNQVSQTLNQEIGMSFFDYVARWRIEASKPLILAADASVLSVALDVGFNSRSTFYKAFKRETGQTPKEYRASPGHEA